MDFQGILLYCMRAGGFACAVCALYALICLLRKRRIRLKRLLGIAYLAALVQITVLRGGVDWNAVRNGGQAFYSLVPMKTTISILLHSSAWNFIYNTLGNLLWFVPLGMMLGRRTALQALLGGAAFSACIELSQFLLMTGLSDVDDVIINALGALLGWYIYRLVRRIRRV